MGKKNLKQHYLIKFCVKLGEDATNAYEKIQKAFCKDSLSCVQVFRRTKTLWMGEKQWKMNHNLDAPPLWEWAQILTVWVLSFVKINVWQLQWLPMNWILWNDSPPNCCTRSKHEKKVCAKMVPDTLNDGQKACPIAVSAEMHEWLESFIEISLL